VLPESLYCKGRREGVSAARSEEENVARDPLIAIFIRPKGERDGREVVDLWNRQAVSCKVNGFDIAHARVASLDSHGLELGRGVDAEPFLTTLIASRAGDAQNATRVFIGPAERLALLLEFANLQKVFRSFPASRCCY
jgi:hypothetical protein